MPLTTLALALLAAGAARAATVCPTDDIPGAWLPAGFCATVFKDIESPRGAVVDSAGDLLVVSETFEEISIFWDDDGDYQSGPDESIVFAEMDGINHAVFEMDGFIYASTRSRVYRWPYTAGARVAATESETEFIKGIPNPGHKTRSIAGLDGKLYVQVGSDQNIDDGPERSAIKIVDLSLTLPDGGHDWDTLPYLADGLRNEVGLTFDKYGFLWGVENGVDRLVRNDIGGDIHDDNPGEEINRFDVSQTGLHYGYPYCFSEYILDEAYALGVGTQWAHPSFMPEVTDEWCRDTDNVVPPVAQMGAHTAPLGLIFYDYEGDNEFPAEYKGDMYVAQHGSWNRNPEAGYKLVRAQVTDAGDELSIGDIVPFFEWENASPEGGDTGNGWSHRPVDVAVGPRGELYFTSDRTDIIGVIYYVGETDDTQSESPEPVTGDDDDDDDDSTGDDDDSTGDDDDSTGDDDDSTGDDDDSTGDDDDSTGDDDDDDSGIGGAAQIGVSVALVGTALFLLA